MLVTGNVIVEANRVGSWERIPSPSKPPFAQQESDGWRFDLATSEFAERPVAFAEAFPRGALAGAGTVVLGAPVCRRKHAQAGAQAGTRAWRAD